MKHLDKFDQLPLLLQVILAPLMGFLFCIFLPFIGLYLVAKVTLEQSLNRIRARASRLAYKRIS